MISKVVKLATLGYVGLKALKALKALRSTGNTPAERPQDIRLAGGPLSADARLQHGSDLAAEH